MWNYDQQRRLALEEKLLERYHPDFRFYNPTGDTYIQGWIQTNGSNRYKLCVRIDDDFPYSRPELFVVSPKTLWLYGGRGTINALESPSHAFHMLGTNADGCVEICHIRDWDASITLVKVILMGILWCEAYDAHLRTGQDVCDFLNG